MSKKLTIKFLLLAILSLFLIQCGGSDENTSGNDDDSPKDSSEDVDPDGSPGDDPSTEADCLAKIADVICDKIDSCEPMPGDIDCAEMVIEEKSIGDVFLESYGFDSSIDDNVSIQDLIDGVEDGTYSVNDADCEACVNWLEARTCSSEETSVDGAYNPARPMDFTNVENMIADDGDCDRIVQIE